MIAWDVKLPTRRLGLEGSRRLGGSAPPEGPGLGAAAVVAAGAAAELPAGPAATAAAASATPEPGLRVVQVFQVAVTSNLKLTQAAGQAAAAASRTGPWTRPSPSKSC